MIHTHNLRNPKVQRMSMLPLASKLFSDPIFLTFPQFSGRFSQIQMGSSQNRITKCETMRSKPTHKTLNLLQEKGKIREKPGN